MREFHEIGAWRSQLCSQHKIISVQSLPDPTFEMEGRRFVSFSTNNYLSLMTSPRMIRAAQEGLTRFGVGNCESRLLGGDLEIYREVEDRLSKLKKKECSLLFATGYLTNIGVLGSLPRTASLCRAYGFRPSRKYKYAYFSDEFNHMSIREGIRVSEADKYCYRHLDLNHLESQLKKSEHEVKIIVTDGVFSQDGDIAPLPELIELAERYDAFVYVDDAHGSGVLGANGGGISEHFGCYSPRLIHMGTLSKAYGSIGGFIATESYIGEVLRVTCSAYGFTSTLPVDQAYAVREALDMVVEEPERRRRLWENQAYFAKKIQELGYRVTSTQTPIIPVLLGSEERCDAFTTALHQHGYHVDPVKFPAVPRGKARLRFIMNANHTREQIDGLLEVLAELSKDGGAEGQSQATELSAIEN